MVGERVQRIASTRNDRIPEEFIRSQHEQPGITTVHGKTLNVPIIDINDPDEQKVLHSIVDASQKWGMFQLVNHGIPSNVISKLKEAGTEFFELPLEEKEIYAKPAEPECIEGYGTKLQKEVGGKKSWVDHLFHKIWPPSVINYEIWPKTPAFYREATEEYTEYLHGVANKVFKCLSLGLGLEEHEVKEALGGESLIYLLKINYYPPCPQPELALGVAEHTDMSTLTILVPNDVQGLQALRDGHWYDVKYTPNALIVHIGDQLEIISNGKYKAVVHRATVNSEKTRITWPVFLEPPADVEIGPHPKLIDGDNPPKYKTKKFGDYFYCKLNKIPQ